MGVYRDCPNFFEYPLLSQERIKLRTSNLAGIFTGSIRTKALKNLRETAAWDCPKFLRTPIILGTDKATNFKFCTHILSIDRNKSTLQISGKVAGCVCEDSRNFPGHPYIGRIARSSLR